MKFMLTAEFKDSWYALSPEKQKKITDAGTAYAGKLAKEGKIKDLYYFGNMKGMVVIYELNSSEDLVYVAENDLFPFVDAELTPLVEIEVAQKTRAK
jgi:hypothetical protein